MSKTWLLLWFVFVCRVMMRKMMDVGGSDDEELVPSVKIDSTSVGEGTYTVSLTLIIHIRRRGHLHGELDLDYSH